MGTYTRTQLRDGILASAVDPGNFFPGVGKTFTLINNIPNVTYFNIEGVAFSDPNSPYGGIAYRQIFNSASISSLVSCSMVTESMHASFIINPSSTASFEFTAVGVPVPISHVRYIATNPTVLSGSVTTVYGVDLSY
jgi:hypothetical protein